MDGQQALRILAEARTSDCFSRNVADYRDDLPDSNSISIIVRLGDIRAARQALGISKLRRDLSE
jgi:hypothetical protein